MEFLKSQQRNFCYIACNKPFPCYTHRSCPPVFHRSKDYFCGLGIANFFVGLPENVPLP